jgi:hypothetical protein
VALPVRVAVIGNHIPRQCGIATFTTDLCDSFAAEHGASEAFVVAVNDPQTRYSWRSLICGSSYEHALIACNLLAWHYPSKLPRRTLEGGP